MSGGTGSDVLVTNTVHAALNYGVATIDTAEGFCTGESAICKPLMGKYYTVAGDASDRLAKTLKKMGMHISQAAAQKADLVVFPEICPYLRAPDA